MFSSLLRRGVSALQTWCLIQSAHKLRPCLFLCATLPLNRQDDLSKLVDGNALVDFYPAVDNVVSFVTSVSPGVAWVMSCQHRYQRQFDSSACKIWVYWPGISLESRTNTKVKKETIIGQCKESILWWWVSNWVFDGVCVFFGSTFVFFVWLVVCGCTAIDEQKHSSTFFLWDGLVPYEPLVVKKPGDVFIMCFFSAIFVKGLRYIQYNALVKLIRNS